MPHFFLKILYLIKHESSSALIFKFIKFQLSKPFHNFLRSKNKRVFNKFIIKKKITHNFFSINCYDWKKNLKNLKISSYLEIGAFEGLSIIFVNKTFQPKLIHAVDTWKGSEEHGKETVFSKVIRNYHFNTKNISNIKNFKMKSDLFFKKKNIKYDLIYIDGLHTKKQVHRDLKNSLELCHKDTIIICDDFFWKFDKPFTKNLPIGGIIPLIKKLNLKIHNISNNQVFLKLKF